MENASKALLMAGGVLLTMMVIGLLVYAWGIFSDYYSNKDDLAEIEDLTEFNLQFTNYDRDDVAGYEIISLANKVADYNERYSNYKNEGTGEEAHNDLKYTPITLIVNFPVENGKNLRDRLLYSEDYYNGTKGTHTQLFIYDSYEQSDTKNMLRDVISRCTAIESLYGSSTEASKLAKSISSLILDDDQLKYNKETRDMTDVQSYQTALDTYNSIVKTNKIEYNGQNIESKYKELVNRITGNGNILAYYEYYQFKKGIFKCNGRIEYDSVSGRVSKITFDFRGDFE